MGFITTAIAVFGTVADAIGVGQYVAQSLKGQGLSAQELFASCFTRAVNRNRAKLARLVEDHRADSIAVDLKRLPALVEEAESQLGNLRDGKKTEILAILSVVLQDAVIIPGHQLTKRELHAQLAKLIEDALADFFTRLPAHPRAVAQAELKHIAQTTADHEQQAELLSQIQAALNGIESKQDELLNRLPYLDPAVIQQESTRPEYKNPFRIVKAEDFNHDYDRLASLFREPSIYDDLRGPDNLIIAGGRGCGKSMLLRSLSALTAIQLRRLKARNELGHKSESLGWKDSGLDYFGVYLKLARGYFYEWSPDCKITPDAATHLFQHVFNLLLLRALIEALTEARSHVVLRIDQHTEQEIVRQIRTFAGFSFSGDAFADLLAHTREEERRVATYIGNRRLATTEAQYEGSHTSIHDFMDFCCRTILTLVQELSHCRIFFLLDEYENLAEFQQQVVNTLAKLRPLSLSLKIATRALGVKSVIDLQGEPIQRPRDYHVVELDYDPNDPQYSQLLWDIASKRLDAEGFTVTDIKRILNDCPQYHPADEPKLLEALNLLLQGSGERLQELERKAQAEQIHHWSVALVFRLCRDLRKPFTYAGFDDFVDLSSGIISGFLELCKLAFYLAQAEQIDIPSGNAIPWEIQNDAVYTASRAYFDYIERNIPDTGAAISRVVLDLADIFREKLLHHTSEPEAARLVIKDPGNLDSDKYKRLGIVLDDAVRWSVFHARGQASAYFPKHKAEVRSNDYLLNRVLAPILRISPRPRWRCTFSTSELDNLTNQNTRVGARNKLRKKHRGAAPSDSPTTESLFNDNSI